MHESILLLVPPPTCIARTIAIRLHDYCAIYDAPPRPPFCMPYTIRDWWLQYRLRAKELPTLRATPRFFSCKYSKLPSLVRLKKTTVPIWSLDPRLGWRLGSARDRTFLYIYTYIYKLLSIRTRTCLRKQHSCCSRTGCGETHSSHSSYLNRLG